MALLLTQAWLLLAVAGCAALQPVRMGFAAELTGKQSELGVNLRNGVQLAIEEINRGGGINGRPIELIVEDDKGTPEGAQAAENRLIDAGVVVVIGHLTSSQTLQGYQVTEKRGVLLFSATASSPLFSGKKDLFYRIEPTSDQFGKYFARYVMQQRHVMRVAILMDEDNNAFSHPLSQAFSETYSALGGEIVLKIGFSGSAAPDFLPMVQRMRAAQPEAVFIIASPLNTASIAQLIRVQDWDVPLLASSWAQGQDLIANGGKAVEGMESIFSFAEDNTTPALNRMKEAFEQRYARPPSFTAIFGYELAQMLGDALKKTDGQADGLGEAFISLSDYQGLTGMIRIDANGDASRQLFIRRLEGQKFRTIATIQLLD